MAVRLQLIGAYCGLAFMIGLLIGFWPIAGFVPPPSPHWDAPTVAEFFSSKSNRIRLGMLICMAASALLLPFGAVIAVQIKRIEGPHRLLTYTQIIGATCLALEFIFPTAVWQAAAFRPGTDPQFVQHLNDLAWLPFLGIISTAVMQGVVFGIAILMDHRSEPIFPRWAAYFNFWAVMMFAPAGLIYFFKTGPFAWNGILAFWLVLIVFSQWIFVNSIVVIRAVGKQQRCPDADAAALDLDEIVAVANDLRSRLAEHHSTTDG
jgi:hypothetical protein